MPNHDAKRARPTSRTFIEPGGVLVRPAAVLAFEAKSERRRAYPPPLPGPELADPTSVSPIVLSAGSEPRPKIVEVAPASPVSRPKAGRFARTRGRVLGFAIAAAFAVVALGVRSRARGHFSPATVAREATSFVRMRDPAPVEVPLNVPADALPLAGPPVMAPSEPALAPRAAPKTPLPRATKPKRTSSPGRAVAHG